MFLSVLSTVVSIAVVASGSAAADPETGAAERIPSPRGPGCRTLQRELPTYRDLAAQPPSVALGSIPEITTFKTLISGLLNPEVDIDSMLDENPYVIFAPSNDAFARTFGDELDRFKTDSVGLTDLVWYHAFLGTLGPDDVEGKWVTVQGTPLMVTGHGGRIRVNGNAKVECGAIHAQGARIYIIDTVLTPPTSSAGA
ncbi:hypothetical protein A5669_05080 [Mycolicibacterium fortuitum]|nr:hypothetical protein A5669_05080 [Mycolicibacterium fortuitum]